MKLIKKAARWILKEEITSLKEKAFGVKQILLPTEIVKAIQDILPDPNEFGNKAWNSAQISRMKSECTIGGVICSVSISSISVESDGEVKGLFVRLSNPITSVFIPLSKDKYELNVCGVTTEIETYVWDLYRAGIKVVTEQPWIYINSFVNAQEKLLKEFENGKS